MADGNRTSEGWEKGAEQKVVEKRESGRKERVTKSSMDLGLQL